MFRSTGISLCLLAMLGCQTPKMTFYDDGSAMQQQVAALVPAGTSLTDAKKTMRENGFSCSERKPPKHAPTDDSGEPSLVCDYDQMTGIFGSYNLTVKFPCTEEGCVGEPTIDKLTNHRGLCPKEHPASDAPCPIEPAPLWTKVVMGTGFTLLCIVVVPLAFMAYPYGH